MLLDSGRSGCGNVGKARGCFAGLFQAVEGSGRFGRFPRQRHFHSLLRCQWVSVVVEPAYLLRAVSDGYGPVEQMTNGHPTAFHRASPFLSFDLQCEVVVPDGVVPIDGSLALDREHLVEVRSVARNKAVAVRFGGLDGKPPVELSNVAPFQKFVSFFHGRYSS